MNSYLEWCAVFVKLTTRLVRASDDLMSATYHCCHIVCVEMAVQRKNIFIYNINTLEAAHPHGKPYLAGRIIVKLSKFSIC